MVKNYLQNGKWIENPREVVVLVCECGNKYIKTREAQTHCLQCPLEQGA